MNMREVVLTIEITGVSPEKGDRIIEVAGIELVEHRPTGKNFQSFVSPESTTNSYAPINGLSDEFLANQPNFREVAPLFVEFVGGAVIVAHNAESDLRFVNAELAAAGYPYIPPDRWYDTVALARGKCPSAAINLDGLCRHLNIDTTRRQECGALLDARVLAEVYDKLLSLP